MRLNRRIGRAVAACSIVVVAVVVGWRVNSGSVSDRVNNATIVATDIALLLAVWGVLSWWWRAGKSREVSWSASQEQVAEAMRIVASQTLERWRKQAFDLGITVPAPVNVSWKLDTQRGLLRSDLVASPVPGTGPESAAGSPPAFPQSPGLGSMRPAMLDAGVVSALYEQVYARLGQGQLVILGAAGAGKTGAMLLLMLETLARRVPADPVPLWLTLGSWNPARQSLGLYAIEAIEREYPAVRNREAYGPDAAERLVREHRVAFFLDGLDEMPIGAQAVALEAIAQETMAKRIVITSRIEGYDAARSKGRLPRAAVIQLQPVSANAAATYLSIGHDAFGEQRSRFNQLAEYLREHPDSVAARTLDNPFTLTLARAAYTDAADSDPGELARFSEAGQLRSRLMGRFLQTAYPVRKEREYAIRWLAWLAHHMGDSHDLSWWHIPQWCPRWPLRIIVGLTGTLAYGLPPFLAFGLLNNHYPWLDLAPVIITFAIMFSRGGRHAEPQMLNIRLPRGREIFTLLVPGFLLSVAVGTGVKFAFGYVAGAIDFPAILLAYILAFGFIGVWRTPSSSSDLVTAVSSYRRDKRASIVTGLTYGLSWALACAGTVAALLAAIGTLGGGFTLPSGALLWGLVFGFLLGLIIGLPLALAYILVRGAAAQVWITEVILFLSFQGRARFNRLLNDALSRQVLRQAGVIYQFRHASLQDYLAEMHSSRRNSIRPSRPTTSP